MSEAYKRIETKLVHASEPRPRGAVEMPIFQPAMFEYEATDEIIRDIAQALA